MRPMKAAGFLLIIILLCTGLAAVNADDAETLSLSGDIAGLELLSDYPSLKTLTLTDCPAVDLTPIASCSRLTSLTIQWSDGYTGEGTYDLSPLAQCSRLNTLTLTGPGIADLSALTGIAKLTTLSVEGTAVSDFSPIAALSLKHLRLFGADAEAITAIFTSIGRGLESAAVGDCTLTAEANDAVLSGTRLISLTFDNAENIDGESERWAKLKKLTSLTVTNGSVSSLSFLDAYVTTVVVLMNDVLVGGARCTVDFDKYFLYLTNVQPEEMLHIVAGGGRRWLYAAVRLRQGTVPADLITAFSSVSTLLSLDVQAVAPEAFLPEIWDGFDKLEQLKLTDCQDASLEMLSQLSALQRLSVNQSAVSGTDAIGNLRRLRQLSLVDCTVDDWAFLDALGSTSLTLLNLSACNGPDSLAFLENLEKLEILALENAPVTDLEPVTGLQLTDIYLYGCPIADYTPLQTLASLELLYCNEDADLPALGCRVEHRRAVTAD